jgi:type I restriction enzyme S subunit
VSLFALVSFFRDDVIEYATNASVGSTIPYVRWDALSIYQIVIPHLKLMAKFNLSAEPLIHQVKINSKQSRTLAAIRNALLPKLLSGEIRVKDAERFVEEVA